MYTDRGACMCVCVSACGSSDHDVPFDFICSFIIGSRTQSN